MFFKRLVDIKSIKVKLKIFPKTNKEKYLVTNGCIKFVDSYRFISSSLDKLDKNLEKDHFVILKKSFPDIWQYLKERLAYPYDYVYRTDDCKKPVDNLKKEDFFSK